MAVKKGIDESGLNAAVICSGDLSHRLKADGPFGVGYEVMKIKFTQDRTESLLDNLVRAKEEELDELEYSVDVLMPAEKASKEDLDPKKYGVIVSKGFRSGLLLPDLEGVDTVDEQLRIALSKAGIKQSENY